MKQVLMFILLLIILGVGYMMGSHGPDPTQWFAPPTPTPTFTATATVANTATATFTPIPPTPTMTATPIPPKKKAAKKAKKHAKKEVVDTTNELTDDSDEEPAPAPKKPVLLPPEPPERKPICNAPTLASPFAEVEPNNTFSTAQSVGILTAGGIQVFGTVQKVAQAADTAAADAYKVDPNVENADLDVDVYTFTTSTPFLAVLDCYTHVVGRPNPLYHENNYQLEVYNDSFKMVGSSKQNDPVEAVEIAEPGAKFYVVVYGVDGTDGGSYRLTITRKESN